MRATVFWLGPLKRQIRAAGPERRHLRADILAGLPGAISSVPGGMATAILAGVHPIQGLYACFAGPIAGGLTAHNRRMIITTTGAAALAAGSALRDVDQAQRPAAVVLLAVMAGAALLAAGILRLGRLTRFVSHPVMIGFLTGVSVNIICGQLADLTGATAHGPTALARALSIVVHPSRIDAASLLAGLAALAVLTALSRTRLALAGSLLAIVLPTVVVAAIGATSVARVKDVGQIRPGIPVPQLPDFHVFSAGLVTGALAVAVIILVQGAGVGEAVPNEGGGLPEVDRDMIAQGAGNLASSIFGGIPVGGSLGQTAVNVQSGARTRWAGIWSGIWVLAILAAFSGAVGKVALPTLAAVLIYFGVSSLQVGEVSSILRTGPISQVTVITTFIATLLLPVAAAVGIGIALSLLLQLNRDAMDLTVVELVPLEDGRLAEATPPDSLPSHKVTILDVYGSLLYAGSRTLQAKLPDPGRAHDPALVLRLRGRMALGATFLKVISDYSDRLAEVGGRLYLSGMDAALTERLRSTGRLDGPVRTFGATPVIGESTYAAYLDAGAWLMTRRQQD
jgi:sulfate permease, SulP family